MGIAHLSIELTPGLIALIIGIILIIHAKDNYPKLYWGIMATDIGIVFSRENIGWLTIVTDTPEHNFTELFNIEKILKWYALANIVALFPIASLSPGCLNHFRIFTFLLLPTIAITVGIGYLDFSGNITPVHSIDEIIPNTYQIDVKLRVCMFLLSVFTPLIPLIYPMVNNKTYHKVNNNMYLFIGFLFVFLGIYVLFTLNISEFVSNLFGVMAIVFTVLFSIQYLRYESPFSSHINMIYDTKNTESAIMLQAGKPSPTLPLFSTVEAYLQKQHPYTDQRCNIELLAKPLNKRGHDISATIKSQGSTGFREYISYLRLEYFRQLTAESPKSSVKELMFACGFTSRATFYHDFSKKYSVSPSKFIEN